MPIGTNCTSTAIYPLFLNIFLFPELIDSFYLLLSESTDRLRLTEILKSLFFEISDNGAGMTQEKAVTVPTDKCQRILVTSLRTEGTAYTDDNVSSSSIGSGFNA